MSLCNKIILSLIFAACEMGLVAQQMPLYSDYLMNGFVFNPAVAGSDGFTTLSLSSRDQWVGFDNSPKTFVFSAQGRLMSTGLHIGNSRFAKKKKAKKRSGRVGLGAQIFNDRNGLIERTGGQISYAYHLRLRESQLSLGLGVSTFQFKINLDQSDTRNSEPLLNSDFSNRVLVPDLNFGAYLLRSDSYAGFSVANMLQTRIKIGSQAYDYRMFRNYYLMGGKRFLPEETFSYEPSFLLKATEAVSVQADLQMRAYYNNNYYLGVSYRTGSSVGLLIGFKWDRFVLGYAFDYSLSDLQRYSYGSHEINLALKLGDNTRRYKWIQRY
jgi:type IX secretion system PorP/SprF family membrane protein